MISLLAALTGFFGSLLPYFLQIVKDHNDKKHELKLFEKQIKMHKMGIAAKMDDACLTLETVKFKELYSTYKTNIKFVDSLNGMVRPIMAFAFFLFYAFIKYMQFMLIMKGNPPVFLILEVLWSQEDQAIFAGIISFYYGQRTMSKANKNNV